MAPVWAAHDLLTFGQRIQAVVPLILACDQLRYILVANRLSFWQRLWCSSCLWVCREVLPAV